LQDKPKEQLKRRGKETHTVLVQTDGMSEKEAISVIQKHEQTIQELQTMLGILQKRLYVQQERSNQMEEQLERSKRQLFYERSARSKAERALRAERNGTQSPHSLVAEIECKRCKLMFSSDNQDEDACRYHVSPLERHCGECGRWSIANSEVVFCQKPNIPCWYDSYRWPCCGMTDRNAIGCKSGKHST